MRRILLSTVVVLVAAALVLLAVSGVKRGGGANGDPTYTVELNNAFGLVTGEQVKVSGVPAGSISAINLNQKSLNASVTIQLSNAGFGTFHQNATCESRPQSLIGEYFIDCNPGTNSSPALKNGGLIPVSHTFSTIPADLLQNVLRMPYRERLTLIINELGAGVAGNPANLQSALERAVPALTQTDNLLALLAQDSHTLKDLTATADSVITALANNGRNIRRFVVSANNTAVDSATQRTNLRATFHNLPGFLAQLRPALADLGAAADANEPVLANLNASSGQIDRLFTDLVPFSRAAKPAVKSLGQASVTGRQAVNAAGPTVANLNQFAKPTPELAQNLSIVLHDLDTQGKAVESNPSGPGGRGYSGLEALLQYVFNQTNAIDYFGQFGHILALDVFVNECSPYQTPATVASNLKLYGSSFRQCYSWLGPNQPGVNERDPSDPSASIPDPGGAPPGEPGPTGTITTALGSAASSTAKHKVRHHTASGAATTKPTAPTPASSGNPTAAGAGSASSTSAGSGAATPPPAAAGPVSSLGNAIGQVISGILGGKSGSSTTGGLGGLLGGHTKGTATATTPQQAQQLLNYLLAP